MNTKSGMAIGGVFVLLAVSLPTITNADEKKLDTAEWKVGVASVKITPATPMWMAGYAARDKPAEGKVHDLYANGIAIEDSAGTRLVIVTVDLIGIPRQIRTWLEQQVAEEFKLPREALLLNASHTHCGPEIRPNKIYLPKERVEGCTDYLQALQQKLKKVVANALDDLKPSNLSYSHARAGFAMNRRTPTESGVRNHPYPDGPVDHDVPLLIAKDSAGDLKALLFGYACHSTTLSFYQYCGDYAGFAKRYLEETHPGVTALFVAGCGADQNPYPRGQLDLCQQHGRALSNGVEAALQTYAVSVAGPLRLAIDDVTLEFAEPPGRAQLEEEVKSTDKWKRRHAEVLLKELDENERIRTEYRVPIQVVRFGDSLILVALPGEVVVDYSLRLKKELAGPAVWVAGYSNDVFGYLPSLRVLEEGGYEGGDAMRYTAFPGPFASSVEKVVIDKVHELVEKTN